MIEICTIDIELYRVVSPDICTDRVIITEERIAHIKDHHPNDYERFSGYFAEILQVPDYIVEANRPDTAFVMKRVTACGKKNSTDSSSRRVRFGGRLCEFCHHFFAD